jgi:hypothetical protein
LKVIDPKVEIKKKFPGAYIFYEHYSKKFWVVVNKAGISDLPSVEGIWAKGDGETSAWKEAYERLQKFGRMTDANQDDKISR